ncbi:MAG: CoA ester lyase [Robiginitomaculum sp.]|nr:CoA ester lyase [Robiginitomaculum sp.]
MLRSVLFVPAANEKALAKAPSLAADGLILDLEDALAPTQKQQGRAGAIRFLRETRALKTPIVVRINADRSSEQSADIQAIAGEGPTAILVPKVQSIDDLHHVYQQILAARTRAQRTIPALWAMIETPLGVLNLTSIAQNGRAFGLSCFIAGTNDLAVELQCSPSASRIGLLSVLSQIVVHGRAYELVVLDGVYNDFSDEAGCAAQAKQGKALGFDGKTLIHPNQIPLANQAFGPSLTQIKHAKKIIAAYKLKKNAGKGAINIDGQMVERLHFEAAKRLIAHTKLETMTP